MDPVERHIVALSVSLRSTVELAQNVLKTVLISGGMVLVMSVKDVESEVVVRTSYRVWVGVGVHAIHCVPGTRSRAQARREMVGEGKSSLRAVLSDAADMSSDITTLDAPRRGDELCSSCPS